MRRSTRLLVLNNYPLDVVWDEFKRREKPDHHLYGINHLERLGYEIRIVSGDAARGVAVARARTNTQADLQRSVQITDRQARHVSPLVSVQSMTAMLSVAAGWPAGLYEDRCCGEVKRFSKGTDANLP